MLKGPLRSLGGYWGLWGDDAQIISYLKLTNKKVGLLINFNVHLLKNGFKRFVNNF
ncbi:MAG: hypothetical protein JNN28_12055 [Saprospiraceae bacterium]|nr:hypothetical protein [Saprospiraceae bacterium]